MVGFREIHTDFEAFNRQFYIKGSDSTKALEILHATAMETLLQTSPNLEWQFSAYQAAVFQKGVVDPETFRATIESLIAVVETVPEYYRQDNRFDANFTSPF